MKYCKTKKFIGAVSTQGGVGAKSCIRINFTSIVITRLTCFEPIVFIFSRHKLKSKHNLKGLIFMLHLIYLCFDYDEFIILWEGVNSPQVVTDDSFIGQGEFNVFLHTLTLFDFMIP